MMAMGEGMMLVVRPEEDASRTTMVVLAVAVQKSSPGPSTIAGFRALRIGNRSVMLVPGPRPRRRVLRNHSQRVWGAKGGR